MYQRPALALGALCLILAACGDADGGDTSPPPSEPAITTTTAAPTTTSAPAEACSAAGATVAASDDPAAMPAAVVETRDRIVDLAVACDFDGLAELALAGQPFFTFSFGASDDPAAFWRDVEATGDPVMLRLVQVLGLSPDFNDQASIWFWPAVANIQFPTPEDYDEVRSIYDDEDIALFEEFGGYIGYRVGIQSDGDWLSFVAGD